MQLQSRYFHTKLLIPSTHTSHRLSAGASAHAYVFALIAMTQTNIRAARIVFEQVERQHMSFFSGQSF